MEFRAGASGAYRTTKIRVGLGFRDWGLGFGFRDFRELGFRDFRVCRVWRSAALAAFRGVAERRPMMGMTLWFRPKP